MEKKSQKILVVDDDVDICQNMCDILGEYGYHADMAHDGASALKLLGAHRYDVALLDFRMPDTDGAALYEQIKQMQPSLVAIMVTAYAGSDGVQRAKDAGTWHVMRKPVDIGDLLGLIESATSQPIVLLVDDDPEFCENMWCILRDQNIRVAIANDNESAIDVLGDLDADVVLLDIHLGAALCTPVFEKLVSEHPMPSICLITGDQVQADFAKQLVSRGAECLMRKPLDMGAVLQKIRSLLPHPK